jgi:hypothetical protein
MNLDAHTPGAKIYYGTLLQESVEILSIDKVGDRAREPSDEGIEVNITK